MIHPKMLVLTEGAGCSLRWREMSSMLTVAEVKVALRQRPYRVLLALGPG